MGESRGAVVSGDVFALGGQIGECAAVDTDDLIKGKQPPRS